MIDLFISKIQRIKVDRLLLLLFLVFININAKAQKNVASQQDIYYTSSDTTLMMHSKYFGFERKVFVELPPLYKESDQHSYDVIYVFDAQNKPYFDMVNGLKPFIDMQFEQRFIVVGICSPQKEDYSRQDDFLPFPQTKNRDKFYNGHCGHADSLSLFIKNELMPYIDTHYRTTGHTLGIGHSLGASFVLEGMVNHELFTDYIAISPNMTFDSNRVAKELEQYNYSGVKEHRFLFLSDAGEERIKGWESWKPAREELYQYYKNHPLPSSMVLKRKSYPDFNHMSCYPTALHDAMASYFQYRDSIDQFLNKESYKVHIELKIDNPKDEVYITGNQDVLGNWNPQKIKMKKVSDTIRAIDLELHYPALFKFTRGNWDTEGYIVNDVNEGINLRIESPKRNNYQYVLDYWVDRP
jgi:predicted alpha/beta superfamily hydrolase